jgi:hypothetical protein
MAHDRSLDLKEDRAFQRREWRVQRIAWVLWGALVLAALAGLVGPGPLSERTAASADGRLQVEYDRFLHHHHPNTLRISMRPAEGEDSLRLHLSREMLGDIRIERIEPQPVAEELDSRGTTYVFRCRTGEPLVEAVLYLQFEAIGRGSGEMRLSESGPVVLNYFVYP